MNQNNHDEEDQDALNEIKALARHEGELFLDDLTSLSDAAAAALGGHKGWLYLDGLTGLSDAAAKALSRHQGSLTLSGLASMSDAAVEALVRHGDVELPDEFIKRIKRE